MSGILVVCAANVCRSPLAELVLRQELAALGGPGIRIGSAGMRAVDGAAICEEVLALRAEQEWRQRCLEHRSRVLDAGAVEDAALILAATREIRSAVVAAVPSSRRRAFTLREAAWLGSDFLPDPEEPDDGALRAFAAHLDEGRGLRPLPGAARRGWLRTKRDPFDIEDGHGSRAGVHRQALREVDQTARSLARLIAGAAAAAM